MNAIEQPKVVNSYSNEWEFVFPLSIHDEEIYDEYYHGVELLDCNDKEAEHIFKKIIKKHPYHIDAYNHLSLAFKNQKKSFESFLTVEKVYFMGKSCLPEEFKQSNHKLPWSNLNNRPFLRSCHILGMEYQDKKQYEEAIRIYSEILDYNERDNQGIRCLLLDCFFALKDFDNVAALIKKYKEDGGIEFVYGQLLLAIIDDKKKVLKTLLANAIERNKFVPKEIMKSKHTDPVSFHVTGGVAMGSEKEAYEYWKNNKDILSDKRIKLFFETVK